MPLSFEGGLNTFDQPSNMQEGEASVLQNWQWLPTGMLIPRPGWKAAGASPTGSPSSMRGRGIYTGWYESGVRKLVLAQYDNSSSFTFYRTNVADPTTFTSYTSIETGVAVASANRPEPVGFETGMGVLMYTNPGFPSARLRTWNGSVVTQLTTDGVTGGSLSNIAGRFLIYHLNRFWTGGALTAAGPPEGNPTFLRYSEIGDVDAWNTDENFIPVSRDDGEPIEWGVVWDRGLVLGKQHSLWFLSGYSVDTFTLSPISRRLGCARGKTLIPSELGVFIVGIDGNVHLWDGAEIKRLSQKVFVPSMPASGYMNGAWVGGQLYVNSTALPGEAWVWEAMTDRWRREVYADSSNAPNDLEQYDERYLLGQSTAGSRLLSVRQEIGAFATGTYRDPVRDVGVAEAYATTSKEHWPKGTLGKAILRSVYIRYRQWTGGTNEALTITPVVDGVDITSQAKTVGQKAAAGVYVEREDFAAAEDATRTGRNFALKFTSSPTNAENETYSIEDMAILLIADEGRR